MLSQHELSVNGEMSQKGCPVNLTEELWLWGATDRVQAGDNTVPQAPWAGQGEWRGGLRGPSPASSAFSSFLVQIGTFAFTKVDDSFPPVNFLQPTGPGLNWGVGGNRMTWEEESGGCSGS